jgi:hypothetical protein
VMMIAALLPTGCSFLFVHGPPSNHAQAPQFDCSDGVGWPVVDVIWAGLNGIGAASAANDGSMIENPDQVVAVGVAWLVVSGISAIYGFAKTSECRDAKHLRDEQYPAGPYTTQVAYQQCMASRKRAYDDARRTTDKQERLRLIQEAPSCDHIAPWDPGAT